MTLKKRVLFPKYIKVVSDRVEHINITEVNNDKTLFNCTFDSIDDFTEMDLADFEINAVVKHLLHNFQK